MLSHLGGYFANVSVLALFQGIDGRNNHICVGLDAVQDASYYYRADLPARRCPVGPPMVSNRNSPFRESGMAPARKLLAEIQAGNAYPR